MNRFVTRGFCIATLLTLIPIAVNSRADEPRERDESAEHRATEAAERTEREAIRRNQEVKRESDRERNVKRERDEARGHTEFQSAIQQHEHQLRELQTMMERLRQNDAPQNERAEVEERIADVKQALARLRQTSTSREGHRSEGRDGDRPSLRREHEANAGNERIEHLRIAAEHLEAAGLHDLAQQVRRNAEQLQQAAHASQRDREHAERAEHAEHAEHRDEPSRLQAQLEELRREVRKLREQVNSRE